jgi:hypothetical protein
MGGLFSGTGVTKTIPPNHQTSSAMNFGVFLRFRAKKKKITLFRNLAEKTENWFVGF